MNELHRTLLAAVIDETRGETIPTAVDLVLTGPSARMPGAEPGIHAAPESSDTRRALLPESGENGCEHERRCPLRRENQPAAAPADPAVTCLAAHRAGEAAWIAAMRTHIWHRRYPPSSVMQALGTPCGHPVPSADLRVYAGWDIMMRIRGWTFLGECSGPEVLTWIYEPSDAGEGHLDRGLEPVTAIAATLDRSLPTDTVHDCEVEVLLVGTPYSQARLTGLTGPTPHLALIEAHRPGDPISLPFPLGRARATDHADQPPISADR